MGTLRPTVRILNRLFLEKVVHLKVDPLGHRLVLADGLGRAFNRLGQVLYHKLHGIPSLGQLNADETMASSNVHESAFLLVYRS